MSQHTQSVSRRRNTYSKASARRGARTGGRRLRSAAVASSSARSLAAGGRRATSLRTGAALAGCLRSASRARLGARAGGGARLAAGHGGERADDLRSGRGFGSDNDASIAGSAGRLAAANSGGGNGSRLDLAVGARDSAEDGGDLGLMLLLASTLPSRIMSEITYVSAAAIASSLGSTTVGRSVGGAATVTATSGDDDSGT